MIYRARYQLNDSDYISASTEDSPLPAKDFDKLLTEAIDEGLSSLGETMRQTVYSHLEEEFGVHKTEIPYKVATFAQAVEAVLGVNANDLEATILKRVYEKFGRRYEGSKYVGATFAEQVDLARSQLYMDFVGLMQSAVVVFYLENWKDLRSFRLIALNSAAAKLSRFAGEGVIGKTMVELYPEVLNIQVQEMLSEVFRYGKPKDLGELYFADRSGTQRFSVAAFLLSSNCISLVFKNAPERKSTTVEAREVEEYADAVEDGMGGWRWEPEVVDKGIYSDKSRAREQWTKQKMSDGPRTAEFFSIRGKKYLEDREFPKAREFFLKAEKLCQRMNQTKEAFRNASLRISAYVLEENVKLPEFSNAAETYFKEYSGFSAHEGFVKNLAYYNQWEGYKHEQEHSFDDSRRSYSEAERLFRTLNQMNDAVFNAAQSVLTFRSEGSLQGFDESATVFLKKYRELSENKHYKEVLAHHYSREADKSQNAAKTRELRGKAEKLFLETNRRELAFENACKLQLSLDYLGPENDESMKKYSEQSERFLDEYHDFAENQFYVKIAAEHYLIRVRALASQLKEVLR